MGGGAVNEREMAAGLFRALFGQPAAVGLTDFKRAVYRRYQHARHLQVIDDAIEAAARWVDTGGAEGLGHIIISMPPRHGKTMTTSRLMPAWFLGRWPERRVILASYGADLARKNSRWARNVIGSAAYQQVFPGVRLAADSRAAESFDLAGHEGGLDAVGVGGGLTGKGGHIIVVDDPIKSRAEAESLTYRNKVWDWYTDDLYTRREPGGAVIVVMTRWHADDLVGRLLKTEPDKWHEIRLPAIAEACSSTPPPGEITPPPTPPRIQGGERTPGRHDDEGEDGVDIIGRRAGEALWPERYGLEALREIEKTLGPYAWAGLYQQRPTLAEGGVFKREWLHRVNRAPEDLLMVVRYWDLAMSAKTSADYTAGVKMGIDRDGHLYVLDVARGQIDWGDLVEYMAGVILRDGPDVIQGIEQQGYMSRAVKELNADGRLRGYAVFGYPKDKDKYTNALPLAAKAAAGFVHVVESHWTDALIEELCAFTGRGDETDDQVDATAGALEMQNGSGAAGAITYAEYTTIGGDY